MQTSLFNAFSIMLVISALFVTYSAFISQKRLNEYRDYIERQESTENLIRNLPY